MSDLAELERALREDSAFARLASSHSHRAVREDSLGFTVGRDALLARGSASGEQGSPKWWMIAPAPSKSSIAGRKTPSGQLSRCS